MSTTTKPVSNDSALVQYSRSFLLAYQPRCPPQPDLWQKFYEIVLTPSQNVAKPPAKKITPKTRRVAKAKAKNQRSTRQPFTKIVNKSRPAIQNNNSASKALRARKAIFGGQNGARLSQTPKARKVLGNIDVERHCASVGKIKAQKSNVGRAQIIYKDRKAPASPSTFASASTRASSAKKLSARIMPAPMVRVAPLSVTGGCVTPIKEASANNTKRAAATQRKTPAKSSRSVARESNEHRLTQRQKQIDIGYNTVGYLRLMDLFADKNKRPKVYTLEEDDKAPQKVAVPATPDKYQVCSKRSWDGQVRKWRRLLHQFDPEDLDQQKYASKLKPFERRVVTPKDQRTCTNKQALEQTSPRRQLIF